MVLSHTLKEVQPLFLAVNYESNSSFFNISTIHITVNSKTKINELLPGCDSVAHPGSTP